MICVPCEADLGYDQARPAPAPATGLAAGPAAASLSAAAPCTKCTAAPCICPLCPVCGRAKNATKSMPPRGVVASVMAGGSAVKTQLTRAGAYGATVQGLRCCAACKHMADRAADTAAAKHSDIAALRQNTESRSKVVSSATAITSSEGKPLVRARDGGVGGREEGVHDQPLTHLASTTTTPPPPQKEHLEDMASGRIDGDRALVGAPVATTFKVWDLVNVKADTGPGILIIPGTARVVAVRGSGTNERYDVKYVLGGASAKNLRVIAMSRTATHTLTSEGRRPSRVSRGGGGGSGGGSGSGGGGESESNAARWKRLHYDEQQRHAQEEQDMREQHAHQLDGIRAENTSLVEKLEGRKRVEAALRRSQRELQQTLDRERAQRTAAEAQVGGWVGGWVVHGALGGQVGWVGRFVSPHALPLLPLPQSDGVVDRRDDTVRRTRGNRRASG
jgi:hypothetical protein